MKRNITLQFIAGAVFFVIAQDAAFAQLSGHNFRGDYGMQSGSQPPPGWSASLMYFNYKIDAVRDRNGNSLPSAGGDITVRGISPVLWWVTDEQLLGGNYSFMVAPSFANNSLDSPLLETKLKTDTAFGDLYVQPINLGWHTDRFDYMAGVGLFAPTGKYEDGADDNVGLGMWTFELFAGTTAYFDEDKTWHAAILAAWETHTEKKDSDIKVGNLLTLEGGVGKSFMDGAINVGAAYLAQWKLTDDDFGGVIPNGAVGKHRIFAAGPEVTVPLFATDNVVGLLSARYLWDFGARSTAEGDTLIVTFILAW
ncbi:MAG: transporter [Verrucomicrobia bacterium]|nr:transporter [Verrucomicrobiota bacterium]